MVLSCAKSKMNFTLVNTEGLRPLTQLPKIQVEYKMKHIITDTIGAICLLAIGYAMLWLPTIMGWAQ